MMESDVQQLIQIDAVNYNCILMRNNSGALKDIDGRVVRFGLGNISNKHSDKIKSSDLIGLTRITITPDMVGHTVAVFTAIEIKSPTWKSSPTDKRERAQRAFTDWIKNCGGISGFANSVEAFRKIMGR